MQSDGGDVKLYIKANIKSAEQSIKKLSTNIKQSLDTKFDSKSFENNVQKIKEKTTDLKNLLESKIVTKSFVDNVQKVVGKIVNLNDALDAKLKGDKWVEARNEMLETEQALDRAKQKLIEYNRQKELTQKAAPIQAKYDKVDTQQLEILRAAQKENRKITQDEWDKIYALEQTKIKYSEQLESLRKQGWQNNYSKQKAAELRAEVQRASNAYSEAEAKVRQYSSAFNQIKNAAKIAFSGVANAVKKITSVSGEVGKKLYSGFKTAFSKIVSLSKSALSKVRSHFNSTRKSSNNMFSDVSSGVKRGLKMLLKYGLGVRGLFVLFRKLRTAAKEGFKNLGGYSDSFNKTVSDLLSASLRLKNAFAAAFQPLASAVLPIVTKIVNSISDALTKLGELLAALTGQKYYYKAVNTTAKYVEKQTKNTVKKVQKYLSPLDDINLFTDKDNGADTSGAGNIADPSKMFTTEKVGDKMKSLADKIKSLFKSKDWTELGTILGNTLNKALSKIPWSKIDSTLQGVAKRIYTLLNGFIGAVDWALVGDTIAKGVRTGLRFAYALITGFNWARLGTAIGTLINNALSAYNASLFAKTLSELLKNILNTLVNLVETINWGKVSRNVIALILNVDTGGISRWASRLLMGLSGAIESTNFSGIGKAFRKGLARINWKTVWDNTARVFSSLLKGLADFFGLKGVTTTPLKRALQSIYTPIKNTWNVLKNLAGAILQPLINNLLPAIVKATGAILKGVIPIIKAVTPFVKFVIQLVGKVISSLSPVLTTIGKTLANIAKRLTPWWTLLGNIINAIVTVLSPVLNVILGVLNSIFSVVAKISESFFGIFNTWFSAQEGTSVSASIQKELDNLSSASDDLKTVKENMESTIKSVDEGIKSTQGDIAQIDNLKNRMDELLQKSTLTPAEMQELNTIVDLISEKEPKFKETWDKLVTTDKNGNLQFVESRKKVIQKIDDTIEALKRQYATEALKEQYKSAYKEQIANNAKIAESTAKVTEAERKLADQQTKNRKAYEEIQRLRKAGYDENSKEIKSQEAILHQTSVNISSLQKEIGKYQVEVLKASGTQGKINSKLKGLSEIISVVSGKYDKNKKSLQALRTAYEAGFIDSKTLKTQFGLTANEIYKGTKSSGVRATEGMKAGVKAGKKNLEEAGTTVADSSLKATYKALKLGSPSKEYKKYGVWSVEGYELGIKARIGKLYEYVTSAFSKVATRAKTAVKPFNTLFNNVPVYAKSAFASTKSVIKNALNVILGYFQSFFNRATAGLNSLMTDFGKVNNAIPKSSKTAKFVYEKIPQIKIPKLATGAVIPPNKEFMAVLGDQKQGNNIEAPENLIRRIVREESGNTYTVNAKVGSKTLFSIILDEAKLKQVQTGHSPFDMIKGV